MHPGIASCLSIKQHPIGMKIKILFLTTSIAHILYYCFPRFLWSRPFKGSDWWNSCFNVLCKQLTNCLLRRCHIHWESYTGVQGRPALCVLDHARIIASMIRYGSMPYIIDPEGVGTMNEVLVAMEHIGILHRDGSILYDIDPAGLSRIKTKLCLLICNMLGSFTSDQDESNSAYYWSCSSDHEEGLNTSCNVHLLILHQWSWNGSILSWAILGSRASGHAMCHGSYLDSTSDQFCMSWIL